jgi:hypothetical protein
MIPEVEAHSTVQGNFIALSDRSRFEILNGRSKCSIPKLAYGMVAQLQLGALLDCWVSQVRIPS